MSVAGRLDEFLSGAGLAEALSVRSLFVLGHDGQVLYHRPRAGDDASVGVLVAGAWQASMALSRLMGGAGEAAGDEARFRMSFGTSDSGVYVLPLADGGERLYLGLLYEGDANPARLRNGLRVLRDGLEAHLGRSPRVGLDLGADGPGDGGGMLLADVTDEEIERLFSGAGG